MDKIQISPASSQDLSPFQVMNYHNPHDQEPVTADLLKVVLADDSEPNTTILGSRLSFLANIERLIKQA
jgi:hypothetical protein